MIDKRTLLVACNAYVKRNKNKHTSIIAKVNVGTLHHIDDIRI